MTCEADAAPTDAAPQIVVTYGGTLSPDMEQTLAVLHRAVAEALDRKRRLGQYAVMWRDGKTVRVEAADLPRLP